MAAGGWIESHQSLSKHRKLLHLAAELGCDRHKVIGHLHEFWWWALDNADVDGTIGRLSDVDLARAAEWPIKSRTRWQRGLLVSGFIECREGIYVIHDWFDFAGKLMDSREMRRISNRKAQQVRRDRQRQHNVSADGQHASAVYRTVPTDHVVVGVNKAPGPRAHDPGPGGPVTRAEVVDVGTGAQQCPICRQVFTGEYLEHTAAAHKVRDQPEDFRGKRGAVPYDGQLLPDINPVPENLAAEHERLLAKDRANGT